MLPGGPGLLGLWRRLYPYNDAAHLYALGLRFAALAEGSPDPSADEKPLHDTATILCFPRMVTLMCQTIQDAMSTSDGVVPPNTLPAVRAMIKCGVYGLLDITCICDGGYLRCDNLSCLVLDVWSICCHVSVLQCSKQTFAHILSGGNLCLPASVASAAYSRTPHAAWSHTPLRSQKCGLAPIQGLACM